MFLLRYNFAVYFSFFGTSHKFYIIVICHMFYRSLCHRPPALGLLKIIVISINFQLYYIVMLPLPKRTIEPWPPQPSPQTQQTLAHTSPNPIPMAFLPFDVDSRDVFVWWISSGPCGRDLGTQQEATADHTNPMEHDSDGALLFIRAFAHRLHFIKLYFIATHTQARQTINEHTTLRCNCGL